MPKSAQQMFAESRLGLVDDLLRTAGWTEKDGGWVPPESYREAIERTQGRGSWDRHNAIMFMVHADEAVLAAGPAHDSDDTPVPKP
jgi:hypothetical protein